VARYWRVPTSVPDSEEICSRLDRIRKLCNELESAQDDTKKYHVLIERIRSEADLFRRTLGTHDSKV
jgi:hypothetical protein